jgi:hypothetical protein
VFNNRSTPEKSLGNSKNYNNSNGENGKKDKFLEHREWDNTHTTLRKYNRLISKKQLMFLNNSCLEDKDSLLSWKPCYAFVLT